MCPTITRSANGLGFNKVRRSGALTISHGPLPTVAFRLVRVQNFILWMSLEPFASWRWRPLESAASGKAGRLIWLGRTDSAQSDRPQGGTHALLFHTQSPRRSLPSGCELFRLELSGQSIHLACGLSWSRSSCWSWPPTTLTISFSLVRRGD